MKNNKKILPLFLFFFLLICSNEPIFSINPGQKEQTLSLLSSKIICVKPNEEFKLNLNWNHRYEAEKRVFWLSTNNEVATIVNQNVENAVIKTVNPGQCDIKIFLERRQIASCHIIVDEDGVIKILAIGNSFSDDALEHHLYGIVKGEGIDIVIGNMYIGGCSLERHWQNAQTDADVYSYRKIVNGIKETKENFRLSNAIVDENWDYISFQQASHFSGLISTYEPFLPPLMEYVKKLNENSSTKYVLHQTWAYASTSEHDGFRNYNNDQMKMYNAIVKTVAEAAFLVDIRLIVPVGTAIQNARTSFVGDNFCSDGYHLDANIGRYTASCTWAEKLLGLDVITSTYCPEFLTWEEILVARVAAFNAVQQAEEITTSIFQ